MLAYKTLLLLRAALTETLCAPAGASGAPGGPMGGPPRDGGFPPGF